MNRYYRKYLPYIIFFSTILVGTVTMLTAIQLKKPTEERPVVSEPSRADDGFNNVDEQDRTIQMKECTDNSCSSFTGNTKLLKVDMNGKEYLGNGRYRMGVTVDYDGESGPGFTGTLVWYLFFAKKDDSGNFDPGSCNRTVNSADLSEVVSITNGERITVEFTVPDDQRWCGCFQFDANVSRINEGSTRWERDTDYNNDSGAWTTGIGGVCETTPPPPAVCDGSCSVDSDCASGLTCFEGVCRNPQCTSVSGCQCPPPPEPLACGGECSVDNQCQSGLVCYQNACRNPSCVGDTDCSCDLKVCNDRCENDSECGKGLSCIGIGGEDKFCRNPSCTTSSDCVCRDATCPVVLPEPPVFFPPASWENNDPTTNILNVNWQDFNGETLYELYLVSDGTEQSPTEGSFYLMKDARGNPLPIVTLREGSTTYKWTIPNANDVNGRPLRSRTYYRFLLRGIWAGQDPVDRDKCYEQAIGARITKPVNPVCIGLTATPMSGDKPLNVTFTGNTIVASESDSRAVNYKFVFGDGEEILGTNNIVSHTYSNANTYTAKLFIVSGGLTSVETPACTVQIGVTEPDDKRLICRDNACVEVTGSGDDQCDTDSDCEEDTYMICRNQACVEVSGSGDDQCDTNNDCVTGGSTTNNEGGTTQSTGNEKPVVPDTGGNDLLIYTLISIGLLAGGGVLIIRGIVK